jgi:hypothetical protein
MTPASAASAGIAPGSGAALVEALVAETLDRTDVLVAVRRHRDRHHSAAAPALGPLLLPVSAMAGLLDALDSDRRTEPLDLVLVADTGLVEAAEARAVLLDDDRVALQGLHLTLPLDGPLADSARLTLDTLDFALPAAIGVPRSPGWEGALDVLAADGAEHALLEDPAADLRHCADFVVGCVRRGLAFRLGVGAAPTAALAGTAAALDAQEPAHVAALLAAETSAQLAVLADADPRSVRRRLVQVASATVDDDVAALTSLGLLAPLEA